MTQKKVGFFDFWTCKVRLILLTVLAIAGTLTIVAGSFEFFAWGLWAQPKVQNEIHIQVDPRFEQLTKELEFQNSLLMKDMTLEEIQSLERDYAEYRRIKNGTK